jgi:BASS family bile acid:Na+ symporter
MEIVTIIAPFALAFIMLGLGLGLTVQDFLRVIKVPKDFLIGFICQLILLPLVAFGLIKLLNTSSELAIGVILIAAAPGGVTSNVFTKFANGDVALSISLTSIISLVSIITVPFIIFTSMDFFEISIQKEISMIAISLKMFLVVTVPVIIGMLIRHFAKEFVIRQALLIQRTSIILFALVFTAIYMEEWDNIISYFVDAGLIVLILNVAMMVIGFYIAKFFVSGVAQQRCISIECGLQNGTLAVFVGTQIFNENISTYIAPTAAYALIMMITSIFFIFVIKKNT